MKTRVKPEYSHAKRTTHYPNHFTHISLPSMTKQPPKKRTGKAKFHANQAQKYSLKAFNTKPVAKPDTV